MYFSREHYELQRLRSGHQWEFTKAGSTLSEAQICSEVALYVLSSSLAVLLPEAGFENENHLCVIAFGSLGRLEFSPHNSDFDVLLVHDSLSHSDEELRDLVLTPLARMNPWLRMDRREEFLANGWSDIPNADLAYPVYSLSALVESSDRRTRQRRWQVLLESRCLYGRSCYETLWYNLAPTYVHQMPTAAGGGVRIDVDRLLVKVGEFFASFEDPTFLYKSTFKYWKTRFLREFYAYSNLLNFVAVGMNRYHAREYDVLRAPSLLKISRASYFANWLSRSAGKGKDRYRDSFRKILEASGIGDNELADYGESSMPESSRILHAILVALVAKFCACWERLYSPHVREALEVAPLGNPDGRFLEVFAEKDNYIIKDLFELRQDYLRLMSASAKMIELVLDAMPGRASPAIRNALEPFRRDIEPPNK